MANDPLGAIVTYLHSHASIGGVDGTWVQAPHLTQPLSGEIQRAVTIEDSGGGSGTGQIAMADYASGRFDVLCMATRADLAKQLALDVEEAMLEARGSLIEYGSGVPRPSVRFITMIRSGGFLSLVDDVQKWPVCFAAFSYDSN